MVQRSAVNTDAASSGAAQASDQAERASVQAEQIPDQVSPRDVREAWEKALRRNKVVRWFVRWLPHRVTILIRTVLRFEHSVISRVRYRWHRSLQLRVIATTLVISTVMIAVLGFFLTEQIADGLLLSAENAARSQALAGLNSARSLSGLTSSQPSNATAETFMWNAAEALQPTVSSNTNYYVVVGLNSRVANVYSRWVSDSVAPDASLPSGLIASVEAEQAQQQHQGKAENLLYYAPTTLMFTDGGPGQPAIATAGWPGPPSVNIRLVGA